jgi:hypothetical protein
LAPAAAVSRSSSSLARSSNSISRWEASASRSSARVSRRRFTDLDALVSGLFNDVSPTGG